MLHAHAIDFVRRVFSANARRSFEPGYCLLSTGRVFALDREEWISSYDSYADRLGTVEIGEMSRKEVDEKAELINARGGLALPLWYSDRAGEAQPYPSDCPGAEAGLIYAEKETLKEWHLTRTAALRMLAEEIQAWNAWNTGNFYTGSIYATAADYLKQNAAESFGFSEFLEGDSIASYASEMLSLTPEEVDEIAVMFD